MLRWRPALLVLLAASSQGAWGASAATPTIFTNTRSVTALLAHAGRVFVASTGGVEEYDARTRARRRLYTTVDGLPAATIQTLAVEDGVVWALADGQRCALVDGGFRCSPGAALPPAAPTMPEIFRGTRITARLMVEGREWIGTAEKGLWLMGKRPRLLTPAGGVCGNHGMAMAAFQGQVWVGTFDEGVCRFDGTAFVPVKAPFRMVNDLVVAGDRLYVATTVGLFRTGDGRRFDKVALFDTRGVNDLAVDGDTLWATSTATLWRIPVGRRGMPKAFWQPGGTCSLQAVDARDGQVWLATEDRGLLRMRGKTFEVFDRAAGLPSSWAVDVAVDEAGGAFAATLRDGLVHVDREGRITRQAGLPDPWLLHVSRDAQGVWVGTQGGAARVAAGPVVTLPQLPNPCVHAILPVGAELWVATEQGLARFPSTNP